MSQKVSPPSVWNKLGGFLHQDFMIMYPDFWKGIEEFHSSISESERKDLVAFLNYINSDFLAGGMPKKYWRQSGAQIIPSKLSVFLKQLLAKIEAMKNEKRNRNT